MNKFKIFNDPIYGFIHIPNELIFDIIEHPYFQRLRRIAQMGLSNYVYPGAHHSRFEHALGCMHLMQKTIRILKSKDVFISEDEEQGLLIAILLHDIGHGPFSHTLENSLIKSLHHESLSLLFMEELDDIYKGQLRIAIKMLKGEYHRKFCNQLVSGQLDIDRLDYLKRDSFYTGVNEGNINSERIITMLHVVDDELVVEKKGIYSVEKFVLARRLMYWMVYLHKTGLVIDYTLVSILKRAKELVMDGVALPASDALLFFLNHHGEFTRNHLNHFAVIDDFDIIMALKQWQHHGDEILRSLCVSIIERKLPKIIIRDKPYDIGFLKKEEERIKTELNLSQESLSYFVNNGTIKNQAYDLEQNTIKILYKNGEIKDLAKASDQLNIMALTKPVTKYYRYFPKTN
ncbi:MAG: phosphohydrolase [Flavobacteriales bacterium]|nr:MAG: phosphohydrolase [Flavobacteriales bacterium]PIE49447.1 MAG: phosphohydrolase [Flavobacteriales bacterium]